jgi:hypothetical protein
MIPADGATAAPASVGDSSKGCTIGAWCDSTAPREAGRKEETGGGNRPAAVFAELHNCLCYMKHTRVKLYISTHAPALKHLTPHSYLHHSPGERGAEYGSTLLENMDPEKQACYVVFGSE